jgi:cytochrome P450
MTQLTYNPFLPEVRLDPYPTYRRLREADPVHFNTFSEIWFLTRYADCAFVLRDPRFSAEQGQRTRLRDDDLPVSMLNSDPPVHTRLRTPVNRVFAARLTDVFRDPLTGLAEELADRCAARGSADLIADFAGPLSIRVLATVLRVPGTDLERFEHWAATSSVNLDPFAAPAKVARAADATDELTAYLAGLVDRWDLLPVSVPDVVAPQRAAGLSRDQIVNTLALLVIGGYEPLRHVVGNGLRTLIDDPGALAGLRARPELMPRAVEELLRFEPPIQLTARVATDEVEVGGTVIRAGQTVVPLLGAANRDPEMFTDPERLDLTRSPNPHLTFGEGVHFCLGAGLARMTAETAFTALLTRFPRIELAGPPPRWRNAVVPRGLGSLNVRC